jgi:hypothetical protein
VGYFVSPEVWCKMILTNVKSMQSFSPLMILAAVIRGSERSVLRPYLPKIVSSLTDTDICYTTQVSLHTATFKINTSTYSSSHCCCSQICLAYFKNHISQFLEHQNGDSWCCFETISVFHLCQYTTDITNNVIFTGAGTLPAAELLSGHSTGVYGGL